jgi:hypothetical protein
VFFFFVFLFPNFKCPKLVKLNQKTTCFSVKAYQITLYF